MLTLLAFGQALDEPTFERVAVPLPEVAAGNWPEWHLYTAPRDPMAVRASLDRTFEGRRGWTRTALGWAYRTPPAPGASGIAGLIGGPMANLLVLRGRAMRRRDAVPQRNVWTTVKLLWSPDSVSSGMPFQGWTIATRPEDDAPLAVPVGEECELPALVGLPLLAHGATFGKPRWVFTGNAKFGDALKRMDRTLAGRSGWRGDAAIPVVGEPRLYPTRWHYVPKAGRNLELTVRNGEAVPSGAIRTETRGWATIVVVASNPGYGAAWDICSPCI